MFTNQGKLREVQMHLPPVNFPAVCILCKALRKRIDLHQVRCLIQDICKQSMFALTATDGSCADVPLVFTTVCCVCCCWDSRLQSWVNKWLTACSRTFLRKTVNTFAVMVPDVLYEQCCLSASLTSWTDAVLFNLCLCSGVTAHSSLMCWLMEAWWLIKTTSSTYIVGGTSWCKRTFSLCWLSHSGLISFLLCVVHTCWGTYMRNTF